LLEEGEGRKSCGCLGGGGEGGACRLARLGEGTGKVAASFCDPGIQLRPPPNVEDLETSKGGFKCRSGEAWGATLKARSMVSKGRQYPYFGIVTLFASLLMDYPE
jgi:hypothetical protein